MLSYLHQHEKKKLAVLNMSQNTKYGNQIGINMQATLAFPQTKAGSL